MKREKEKKRVGEGVGKEERKGLGECMLILHPY
jgi:hypothetical protein